MLWCTDETGHMDGWEKEDEEGAKEEAKEEDAEERAVKEAGKRPAWKENGHEGEKRELSGIHALPIASSALPLAPSNCALKKGTRE